MTFERSVLDKSIAIFTCDNLEDYMNLSPIVFTLNNLTIILSQLSFNFFHGKVEDYAY